MSALSHTQFAPDGYFGLIKYRYRRSRVYTYEELADVIDRSTENGHNICQRYQNAQGDPLIAYRDWSSWLLKYFRKLPNLTNYHHFSMSRTTPGVVRVKERIDTPEEEHALLQRRFPDGPNKQPRLPRQLHPTGLSLERAWYLYEQIREYIPSESDRDQTCPKPMKPKPMKSQNRKS